MNEEIEKHLFGNTDILTEKEELKYNKYTSDSTGIPEFFGGIHIHKSRSFDDFFTVFRLS